MSSLTFSFGQPVALCDTEVRALLHIKQRELFLSFSLTIKMPAVTHCGPT